ncbi:MAG: tetratricopeptide repeat protein [Pyrinomonadaceae bacterium]
MMSRLMSRTFIVFSILTIFACPALGQISPPGSGSSGQLHGQVRFGEGGNPAYQILVRLERFDGGIVDQQYTDRVGRFRFSGLRPLTYIVSIHTPGFNDVQQQVELVTKRNDYIQLTLQPDATSRSASLGPAVILDAKVPLEARREFERGRVALLENGNPELGISHLEKAISVYPSFLEAHLMLGTAYMDAHQLAKAEATLRQAMALDPKKPEAYFALGEVYRKQKKFAEAEKALHEGLKIQERSWQGHYSMGCLYYDMDNLPKSGRHVAKTLQLKPDLAEAHLLGANILLRSRKNEDALMEFEEYLRLEPKGKFAPQAREAIARIKKALAQTKK